MQRRVEKLTQDDRAALDTMFREPPVRPGAFSAGRITTTVIGLTLIGSSIYRLGLPGAGRWVCVTSGLLFVGASIVAMLLFDWKSHRDRERWRAKDLPGIQRAMNDDAVEVVDIEAARAWHTWCGQDTDPSVLLQDVDGCYVFLEVPGSASGLFFSEPSRRASVPRKIELRWIASLGRVLTCRQIGDDRINVDSELPDVRTEEMVLGGRRMSEGELHVVEASALPKSWQQHVQCR